MCEVGQGGASRGAGRQVIFFFLQFPRTGRDWPSLLLMPADIDIDRGSS